MPSSICFPGGAIDKHDESKDWIKFLKHHKIPSEDLRKNVAAEKPFIFANNVNGRLDRETSLRLTAIRETFEELGIVLCRKPSSEETSPFASYHHTKNCDIPDWQKRIHNHKETLMTFCDNFKLVPDIMNIYEWSVWLTPTFFRPRRFETAFFLVALDDIPPVYPESHEVQEFMWESPDELLRKYHARELWLPPPQFFELRRLSTMHKIDELAQFAKNRSGKDMTLLMPMQFKTKDGFLHVLPGDDLYPANPNYKESDHNIEEYADKSFEEMRNMAKNLCRSEQSDMYDVKILCNIPSPDGHLGIVSDATQSKL